MTSFRSQLRAWKVKIETTSQKVFTGCVAEVQASIVNGSALTGEPGQPVDTGYLKSSWIGDYITPSHWQFTTNVAYAPVIEEGLRAAYDPEGSDRPRDLPSQNTTQGPLGGTKRLKSTVGGQGSVKMTRAAWPRIVEYVAGQSYLGDTSHMVPR